MDKLEKNETQSLDHKYLICTPVGWILAIADTEENEFGTDWLLLDILEIVVPYAFKTVEFPEIGVFLILPTFGVGYICLVFGDCFSSMVRVCRPCNCSNCFTLIVPGCGCFDAALGTVLVFVLVGFGSESVVCGAPDKNCS